jgi:hypothetical protein
VALSTIPDLDFENDLIPLFYASVLIIPFITIEDKYPNICLSLCILLKLIPKAR